jgi:L-alanine-DL-glutamate epimerase-like enolase superfamily enzyme
VKIGGPQGIRHDGERLQAVRDRLGDAVALRLDANGMLEADGLAATLQALAAYAPELLEEPTAPEHMFSVAPSPVPLAMDESLLLEGWDERIRKAASLHTHVAVVLKPMVLGGFLRSLAIANAAAAAGLGVIVTHVFDGSIGSTAAACLALAVRGRVLPCGLDAHGRFDQLPTGLTASHVVPYEAYGLGVATS